MKCIKNITTGNIIRVTDTQASQMVGSSWIYTQKSEWKNKVRDVVTESQVVEKEKKSETVSDKQLKRKKLKEKQRK
jgi:hypothetical protein